MCKGKFSTTAVQADAKRSRPTGTVVFYSVYGIFVAIFIVALVAALIFLNNWLVRYEASQPGHKAEEVFLDLFSDPDWEDLYERAGIADTPYENKNTFAAYMTQKVDSSAFTFEETASGLSGDRKYIVSLSGKKIASYTLTGGSDQQADIESWELDTVDLILDRAESILVEKLPGHTVYINGAPLDDSHTIRRIYTAAEDMLPEGVHGYRLEQQYLDGLFCQPEVTVKDENGDPVAMTKDPKTGILTPVVSSAEPMTQEEQERILNAAKAYSSFMVRNISQGELATYFDRTTTIYKDIVTAEAFVQSFIRYEFLTDETPVKDFYRYSDDLFSARVVMTMRVHRTGPSMKDFQMNTTFFFTKNKDGIFLVTNMSNVPMQETKQDVRLTFCNGDNVLSSQMVSSTATTVELPSVTAPAGQYLKGWAVRGNDEQGKITMTIILTPGADGVAHRDPQKALEPMTLYPVFEKEAG